MGSQTERFRKISIWPYCKELKKNVFKRKHQGVPSSHLTSPKGSPGHSPAQLPNKPLAWEIFKVATTLQAHPRTLGGPRAPAELLASVPGSPEWYLLTVSAAVPPGSCAA